MRKRRYLWAGLVGLAVSGASVAYASLRWRPERLGEAGTDIAPPLRATELRAVTFNAWRLSDPARVPALLEALETTNALLASDAPALPELFAVQEIESAEALAALRESVAPTHALLGCECALQDGRLRSAVALGVSRERFEVVGERCVELGRIWPDHPRCAIAAEIASADGGRATVVGVHMAWHLDNSAMAARLRDALPMNGPTVVMGDFNTWPGTHSYARLVQAPLRDACPGAPATTLIDKRVDLVLVSDHWRVERALDRRRTYDLVPPTPSLTVPGFPYGIGARACETDPARCPVTDHLPEGVVLRLDGR